MNCFILFNEAKLWNKLFFQSTIFCKFIFNWRIIALQYCVSAMQHRESPINMHISPPFWTPLPPPLGHHRAPGWAPCVTEASHWLAVIHMVMYTFRCYPFDLSHSFLPLWSRGWSYSDHVAVHALITWLIILSSWSWSYTDHVTVHALITWLVMH